MGLLNIVKSFEGLSNSARFKIVCNHLEKLGLKFDIHKYSTGKNIIVNSGTKREIGVASHFDVVPKSPGANDNASALAVTLDILRRFKENPLRTIGVRGLFFDEEEKGLIGSRNYVKQKKLGGIFGVYNMELVGLGDKIALWSDDLLYEGPLIITFEKICRERAIPTFRFPEIRKILNNSGDHCSFNEVGLKDAFCITTITDEDLRVATKYFSSSNHSLTSKKAYEEAPLFLNYHKSSDKSEYLSEKTLQMVSDLIYDSIRKIDNLSLP